MMKGSIHQDDKAIPSVYAQQNRGPKFAKTKPVELKEEADKSIITVGIF